MILAMMRPTTFYLWAHSEFEELATKNFELLLLDHDVIYVEQTGPSNGVHEEIENAWNNYSLYGSLCDRLRKMLQTTNQDIGILQSQYLLSKAKGKRFVFEKSPQDCSWVVDAEEKLSNMWINYPFSYMEKVKSEFLKQYLDCQIPREEQVILEILALDSPLVLFGAAHTQLPVMTLEKRIVRTQFPFDLYPQAYEIQVIDEFRRTGILNPDLYACEIIESVLYHAFKSDEQQPAERAALLANAYTGMMSGGQIHEFRESFITLKKLGASASQCWGIFCKRSNLPESHEMLAEYRLA